MTNKEKVDEDYNDGDLVQKAVGSIGLWQFVIIISVSLTKVSVSWHQLAILFLAPPQNYWCARSPGFENISVDVWRNISSPPQGGHVCSRYNFTPTDLSDATFPGNLTDFGVIPCTHWEFDSELFEETIISQWNLVCGREFYTHIVQTLYMLGILAGSFIFGVIADKCGRKYPLISAVFLQFITGTITAFCTNFYLFLIMRLLDAFATGGLMVIAFVICMEVVGSKWRAPVAVIYHLPFSAGHLTLPGVAYLFRDWKYFQLAISVPSIFMITYFWLIPESPRWLLTVGRIKEAETILKKAAKRNKLSASNLNELLQKRAEKQLKSSEAAQKASFFDLFKYRNLRKKTLCISFNWIVCGVCFFGLAQYIGQIDGNIFMNVAWGGAIQIPGCLFCAYANQKWGRRKTLMNSQLISGIACLLIVLVPNGDVVWPTVALSTTGLVSMSVAFPTVYLYSGELFPTVVRNAGVGFASMCARIGSMAAPFISGLGTYGTFLPPIVFGIFPILGCVLCLFIPETVDTVLPDTIEEGENCGSKR